MANINKMKASLTGKLRPATRERDDIFQDTSTSKRQVTKSEQEVSFKGDVFTERVTLALTPDQKDFIDELAKSFQRRRTIKKETINRNTVIRALINVTKEVSFQEGDIANNEAEFERVIRSKLLRK
jgi:hypothetical protein